MIMCTTDNQLFSSVFFSSSSNSFGSYHPCKYDLSFIQYQQILLIYYEAYN